MKTSLFVEIKIKKNYEKELSLFMVELSIGSKHSETSRMFKPASLVGGLKRKKICPMQVKHGSIAKPVSLITQKFPTAQKYLDTRRYFATPAFMVVRKSAAMLRSTMTLRFTVGRWLVAEQKYLAVRKSTAVLGLVKVRRSTKTLQSQTGPRSVATHRYLAIRMSVAEQRSMDTFSSAAIVSSVAMRRYVTNPIISSLKISGAVAVILFGLVLTICGE